MEGELLLPKWVDQSVDQVVVLRHFQVPSPLKSVLSHDNVATLEHLCERHNDLQDQLVSAEKERQEAINEAIHYQYGISQALGELSIVRRCLAECFEVAFAMTTTAAQERHPYPGRSSSPHLPPACEVGAAKGA
jgi:hypothetical protein